METTTNAFIRLGEAATGYLWIPVLLWTAVAALTVTMLMTSRRGHAYTRFYVYEALLLSLPAGLLAAGSLNPFRWLAGAGTDAVITFSVNLDAFFWMDAGQEPLIVPAFSNPYFYIGIATALVLVFALIQLTRLGSGYGHLRRIRNTLKPVTNSETLAKFCKLADQLQPGRQISLYESDRINVPVTFGALKPVIVLPPGTDHNDLDMILMHELTHIRRGDYLWMWAEQVIRALFVFHPLVHVMARKLEHYREICCDAEVLTKNTSLTTKGYALALIKYLQPECGLDLTAGMAKPSNIKERISVMNQHRKTTITGRRIAGIILGFILLAGTSLFMACSDNIKGLGDEPSETVSSQDFESVSTQDLLNEHKELRNKVAAHIRENTMGTDISAADAIAMNPEITVVAKRLNAITTVLRERDALPADMMVAMNTADSATGDDTDVFAAVEQMPEMIGGQMAFYDALSYPETARRAGIQGRVIIQFVVDEGGSVINPRVLRGIGGGADEAAVEAITQMKFTPGTQLGQPVKVRMTQPVVFRLQETAAEQPADSP
ncbi:MAG: M56 family metallopeptidase [Rhodothermaceae bacterium]|nr:M56 family metallopeptidase [Rhodothermaceae bacterium]